jgi:hypothetical protein
MYLYANVNDNDIKKTVLITAVNMIAGKLYIVDNNGNSYDDNFSLNFDHDKLYDIDDLTGEITEYTETDAPDNLMAYVKRQWRR